MATGIAYDLATKRLLTWPIPDGMSAAATDLLTDLMYFATGPVVKPQFAGPVGSGVWRSKRIVLDDWPSFGWLRLEGPFISAVVRIYVDGALWHTTATIVNNEPVRLPAGRFREWEIEIQAFSNVTEICLTTTAEEMRAA